MARNRDKTKRLTKAVIGLAAVALVAVGAFELGGGLPQNKGMAAPQPGDGGACAQVVRGEITSTVYGEGSLVPARKETLYTQVAGKVDAVEVEVGDAVQRGDVLLRLSSGDLDSQVASLQASPA